MNEQKVSTQHPSPSLEDCFHSYLKMALLHIPTEDISGYCISPDKSRYANIVEISHQCGVLCDNLQIEPVL